MMISESTDDERTMPCIVSDGCEIIRLHKNTQQQKIEINMAITTEVIDHYFRVPLSSQNSLFLQVLSSIAFPNSPLARLHGYLTIVGVGTSLTGLVWFSAAD